MSKPQIHQDYLTRIRYTNNLPPPPLPPKLLHIPSTGLHPHLLSASYASALVRRHPLNIEADAELGMPLDLVGLPGAFEDDEAFISTRANPNIPPADRPLLRNPRQLGAANAAAATFLRKNEQAYAKGVTTVLQQNRKPNELKRKRPSTSSDLDPKRLKTQIARSFVLANTSDFPPDAPQPSSEDRAAWDRPQHPKNRSLKLLDAYPVYLDFATLPETSSFITLKFNGPPLPMPTAAEYDARTDAAIFRPLEGAEADRKRYEAELLLHQTDPEGTPAPKPVGSDFEMFVPGSLDAAQTFKDVLAGKIAVDEDATFALERVRHYETERQYHVDEGEIFSDHVAVSLEDGEEIEDVFGDNEELRREKGAYLMPIGARIMIRPRRTRPNQAADDGKVDILEAKVRGLTDAEKEAREKVVARLTGVEV